MIGLTQKLLKQANLSNEELQKKAKLLEKKIAELEKKENHYHENVKFLKQIINLAPQLIWAKNEDGCITFYNNSYAMAVGLPPDEDIIVDEKGITRKLDDTDKLVLASGKPRYLPDHPITYSNSNVILHRTIVIPFKDKSTFASSLLYIAQDQTSKETKQTSVDENSLLNAILTSSPDGILIKDEKGNLIECNQEAQDMLRYTTKRELMQKNISDLVTDDYKHKIALNKKLLQQKGKIKDVQVSMLRKDKTSFLSEFSTRQYKDDKNGINGSITFFKDITNRKKTEIALKESEHRFKKLVTNSPNGLLYSDTEGNILEVNPKLLSIFGSPSAEATKSLNLRKYKLLVEAGIADDFELCVKSGEIISNKCEYQSKWGKKLYLSYCFVPITDIKDHLTGILASFEDTTQQVLNQEELVRAITAIENSGIAITVFNFSNQLTFVNKAAVDLWGYQSVEEMLSDSTEQDLWSKEGIGKIKKIWGKLLLEGKYYSYDEIYAKRRDGSVFPLELKATLITDNTGKPIGMTGAWNDITKQKLAKQELIRAKERAEESDRLKSAFLANMSHEIRTPMNGIIGFSNLLKNTKLNMETRDRYIQMINNNGESLINIIDDIIDMAKMEAGQLNMIESNCDLNILFNELHTQFEKSIKKLNKNLLFYSKLPEKGLVVKTDKMRLKQILSNLLSNAIKFTEKGYIETGYFLRNSREIVFYVKDTGPGLPKSKLDHIFERFLQLDNTPSREFGGTGLGLTIAKSLVEMLGGHIEVESIIDAGSRFYFTLPYDDINFQKTELPEDMEYEFNRDINWTGKTVLIAEDEIDNFMLLEEIFKETGANVLHAQDGIEAIEIFINQNIDLVLLDIKMPNKTGYEAVKEMKKIKPDIPVIAQTAYAMSGEKNKILKAGCDDYIAKPIDMDLLIKITSKYLNI